VSQSRATGKRILYIPITRYSGGKPQKYQVQAVTLVDQAGNPVDVAAFADAIEALALEARIQTEISLQALKRNGVKLSRAEIVELIEEQEKRGMIIEGYGINDRGAVQVDKSHSAGRISVRPPELGAGGSYRIALQSGVITAGLVGPLPVWEFRWGQSSMIAIARKLKIQAVASTSNFNATAADSSFSLYRAQGFTAMDNSNANAVVFTKAKAQAVSTRLTSSQLAADTSTQRTGQGGIMILNTAAGGLTAGTKTLDDNPIAIVVNRIVGTAAAETIITPEPPPLMIDPNEATTMTPVELSANEGLVLQVDKITATGTWRLMVEFAWDEVDPQRYYDNY
jgi:hypothetical protein